MFDKMNKAFFEPHMNTMFKLSSDEGEAGEVELMKIDETDRDTHYTLTMLFVGSKGRYLPQKNYNFKHKSIGAFNLFIVPVGDNEKGYIFEAIVTKMKK